MDFNDSPQEAQFRKEVVAWLDANAEKKRDRSDTFSTVGMSEEEFLKVSKEWQQKKYDGGWACLRWPEEYGGRGASPIEVVIWGQEEGKYKVPSGVFEIGQGMCGPVLQTYATEEQKREHLPPMASGEKVWCQLFSEPAAGSDVAGLRTRCVRDGDDWILNGQKVWTSGAHFCDWGIIVVRHDPSLDKYKGLTFFFLNMHSPGVTVKPIKQISGGANFNEVYFEDVRVPDSQRLGAIGDGWKVAITTLMNERLAVGTAGGADVQQVMEYAFETEINGELAINNAAVRERIADWYVEHAGLKYTKFRTISALSQGQTPGPEASIAKVVSAPKSQNVGQYGMDITGMNSMIRADEGDPLSQFQSTWLNSPGIRIAGGTDEILRNIIAERVLGLPQEPRADKGVAFSDIPTGDH